MKNQIIDIRCEIQPDQGPDNDNTGQDGLELYILSCLSAGGNCQIVHLVELARKFHEKSTKIEIKLNISRC